MGKRKRTKSILLAIAIVFLSVITTESLFAYGDGNDRELESVESTAPSESTVPPVGFTPYTPREAAVALTNFMIQQQGSATPLAGLNLVEWFGGDQPSNEHTGTGIPETPLAEQIAVDVKTEETKAPSAKVPLTDREVRIAANAFLNSLAEKDKKNLQANFNSFEILNIRDVREIKERAEHEPNPVIRNYMNNLVQQTESDILAHAVNRRQAAVTRHEEAVENVNQINDAIASLSVNLMTGPFGRYGAAINIAVNTAAGGLQGGATSLVTSIPGLNKRAITSAAAIFQSAVLSLIGQEILDQSTDSTVLH